MVLHNNTFNNTLIAFAGSPAIAQLIIVIAIIITCTAGG